MLIEKCYKSPKNDALGHNREYRVKRMYEKFGYKVEKSKWQDDLNHELDLIARKDKKVIYIQVKGFHDNWKIERFLKLEKKAIGDNAIAYACYVNHKGRIYRRNIFNK